MPHDPTKALSLINELTFEINDLADIISGLTEGKRCTDCLLFMGETCLCWDDAVCDRCHCEDSPQDIARMINEAREYDRQARQWILDQEALAQDLQDFRGWKSI